MPQLSQWPYEPSSMRDSARSTWVSRPRLLLASDISCSRSKVFAPASASSPEPSRGGALQRRRRRLGIVDLAAQVAGLALQLVADRPELGGRPLPRRGGQRLLGRHRGLCVACRGRGGRGVLRLVLGAGRRPQAHLEVALPLRRRLQRLDGGRERLVAGRRRGAGRRGEARRRRGGLERRDAGPTPSAPGGPRRLRGGRGGGRVVRLGGGLVARRAGRGLARPGPGHRSPSGGRRRAPVDGAVAVRVWAALQRPPSAPLVDGGAVRWEWRPWRRVLSGSADPGVEPAAAVVPAEVVFAAGAFFAAVLTGAFVAGACAAGAFLAAGALAAGALAAGAFFAAGAFAAGALGTSTAGTPAGPVAGVAFLRERVTGFASDSGADRGAAGASTCAAGASAGALRAAFFVGAGVVVAPATGVPPRAVLVREAAAARAGAFAGVVPAGAFFAARAEAFAGAGSAAAWADACFAAPAGAFAGGGVVGGSGLPRGPCGHLLGAVAAAAFARPAGASGRTAVATFGRAFVAFAGVASAAFAGAGFAAFAGAAFAGDAFAGLAALAVPRARLRRWRVLRLHDVLAVRRSGLARGRLARRCRGPRGLARRRLPGPGRRSLLGRRLVGRRLVARRHRSGHRLHRHLDRGRRRVLDRGAGAPRRPRDGTDGAALLGRTRHARLAPRAPRRRPHGVDRARRLGLRALRVEDARVARRDVGGSRQRRRGGRLLLLLGPSPA